MVSGRAKIVPPWCQVILFCIPFCPITFHFKCSWSCNPIIIRWKQTCQIYLWFEKKTSRIIRLERDPLWLGLLKKVSFRIMSNGYLSNRNMMVFESAVDLIGLLPSHTIIAYLRGTVYSRNLYKVKLSDEIFFFSWRGLIHKTLINILTVYRLQICMGRFFETEKNRIRYRKGQR